MHTRDNGDICPCNDERYCTEDIKEAFEEDSNRQGINRMRGYYRAHIDYDGH
jgi:hypothetical protein